MYNRDSQGHWLMGSAHNIGRCSSLQAELWALLDGLQLAWSKGFRFIKVEVDCLLVLKLIQREENSASAHSSLINQILLLMEKDWDIDVKHVFREGNKCADFLASYALQLQEGSHFLQDPPFGLEGVLHDDLVGVYQERLILVN